MYAWASCVPTDFFDPKGTNDEIYSADSLNSPNNGRALQVSPFLFNEKQLLHCRFDHDLPNGRLPHGVPFSLTVKYEDIFGHHHLTTFCEIVVTDQGEGAPSTSASRTIGCDWFKYQMD